jgi:hypothetical protein
MDKKMLDIYTDYLICSTSYTTATGLSKITDGVISHDKITKFLSSEDFSSTDLWSIAKPFVRSIENDNGAIIIDDSISKKPYTDENDVICWHFDHKDKRSVKGINFVSALYDSEKNVCPIGYEIVKKTKEVIDKKTGKKRRKSAVGKQEHFRNLLKTAADNNIKFKTVLADIWFATAENMIYIKDTLKKDFVFPLKANRNVALNKEDLASEKFVRIDSVKPGENILVWLEDVDFPLRFTRPVFKDENGSAVVLYLVSSDIELSNEQITTEYKRRWKVEVYHESVKGNTSLEKSPTKTVRTQSNHLFLTLCAFIKLEQFSLGSKLNHFAIKGKIYIAAMKTGMKTWCDLKLSRNVPLVIGPCAGA